MRLEPPRGDRFRNRAATIRDAGRVTAGRLRLEESPDTAGQDAGATQAAKADGKWHRKETARGISLYGFACDAVRSRGGFAGATINLPKVRVKRWGKSPPASWRHGG